MKYQSPLILMWDSILSEMGEMALVLNLEIKSKRIKCRGPDTNNNNNATNTINTNDGIVLNSYNDT